MVASRKEVQDTKPRRPPASTPQAREQQLIAMAYDTAEKQFLDGTASSQVTTHFLKLGTTQHQLELEKLRTENILREAQVENMSTAARSEAMFKEALDAMRSYKGEEPRAD